MFYRGSDKDLEMAALARSLNQARSSRKRRSGRRRQSRKKKASSN